jgi:multiple sugar transport system substrate-binding protein
MPVDLVRLFDKSNYQMSANPCMALSRFDQILKDLRQRLGLKEFKSGERLPSERELAAQYRCSQPTINKVIATLISENALVRKETRGAFVPSNQKERTEPKKSLRFMGWLAAESLGAEMWNAVAASFQVLRPGFAVASNAVPFDQFPERLTQMIGQGRAPDVIQLANIWSSRFAEMGALAPLEGLLPSSIISDHLTWRKGVNTFRGSTYSIDWALTSSLIFCNKTVLREAGLDPERAPKTLAELKAMSARIDARKLRRDGQPVHGFGAPTGKGEVTASYWSPFLHCFTEGMIDDSGNVALDSKAGIQALDYYRELIRAARLPLNQSIWSLRQQFAQDRIGFMIDGSMGRGFFRKESGLGSGFDAHFLAAPMPVGPAGLHGVLAHHHSLAISNQCSAKEEGIAFMTHLLSDRDLARQYFEEEGLLPARQSLLDLPEYSDPYARLVLSEVRQARALPADFSQFQLASVFLGDAINRVLANEATPAEALSQTARTVRLLLHGRSR